MKKRFVTQRTNPPLQALYLLLIFTLLAPVSAKTEDTTYIPVGPGKAKKTVLAFPDIQSPAGIQQSERKVWGFQIKETVMSDLTFMDQYQLLPQAAFTEKPDQAGITPDKFKFTDWSGIGADFLIKTALALDGKNLALESYLYEVNTKKSLISKRYLAPTSEAKALAHQFANDIVHALTGLPGIFTSKIAMSCDRTGKKEIYLMNFDGTEVRQVTHHRSTAMAPTWSPDGTKIAYSLFNRHAANVKNIDLFEFDFKTSTVRLLSNRKGINSGAAYSPDGKRLALTMSFLGNPEIFSLDLTTREVSPLIKSLGVDVDPSFSPSGQEIAFVSNRSGRPMVYKMNSDGRGIQRLTYAGVYNATPSWSPQGNKIIFAGWLDDRFDIFMMNSDGTKIERLTKNQGNNEDPFFSPDGNFIIFSSNRTGAKNVYVMNRDGTFIKRLTYGLGNCVTPKWSNSPQ